LGTLERKLEKKISSLPSNLDEAANRQAALEQPYKWEEQQDGSFGVTPLFVMSNIRSAFKAGAEWMAGQGIKLHGRILPGPKCNLYIESDCFDRGYKGLNYSFSDYNDVDMFVQIRKK